MWNTAQAPSLSDSAIARFWSKVNKTEAQSCWLWQAGKFSDGYGAFGVRGKLLKAHRVAYILHYGDLPSGLGVLHTCDNPACVNPAHLRTGTPADNNRDCRDRGRFRFGKVSPDGWLAAKITRADAQAIRRRCQSGEAQKDVAVSFGLHPSTVSRILSGEHWKA